MVLAFAWPGPTLAIMVIFFGAFLLVDGAFAVVAALRSSGVAGRWWLFAEGTLGVLAGAVTFLYPGPTALVLLYVVAFWAMVFGIVRVAAAVGLRREIEHEWLVAASGVLSVVFGVLLVVLPGAGLLSLVWLVGIWALAAGFSLIAFGFRVRERQR